jgi:hypothetical protein
MESMTTSAASLACSSVATIAHVDRGGEFDGGIGDAETARAQAHLLDGFLARDIQYAPTGAGELRGGLQQQRGFADARVTTDQNDGCGDQPPAQHAVEFCDPGGRARRRVGFAVQSDKSDALAGGSLARRARTRRGGVFLDGVPFAAGLAPPDPFRGDGTAGLADEARDGFGQGDSDREQTGRKQFGRGDVYR